MRRQDKGDTVRVLLLMATLFVAACSAWGPPTAVAPPPVSAERPAPPPGGPIALTPAPVAPLPARPVAVAVAAPPAVAAAPPPAVDVSVWPFGFLVADPFPPRPPRLTLSNFSYDRARIETVAAAGPDCNAGFATANRFDLPYNGTRVIEAPAGADICWRRDLAAEPGAAPDWSRWNRALLSSGRSVDARL